MLRPNIVIALLITALAAFVFSCGGGSPLRGTTANKHKPVVLTRAGELAKLEALPKPANVTEEQWRELKSAMAALVPEKVVCVPPRPDEVVSDLTFNRDAERVGSLTWSYFLPHDYNMDGTVGVGDISAIADHFGEAVGDAPGNWIIDTSGDGFVGIADITGIATRYGLSLLDFSLRQYFTESQFTELALVPRGQAVYDETGHFTFTYPYDTTEWVDLAVVPMDALGDYGGKSNVVQFQPPRIVSLTAPSGKVGDVGTFSAVVEGATPLEYSWVLSNGCNPRRSTEASVDATFVMQGGFNGNLTVTNLFGTAQSLFSLAVGVPPAVISVTPVGNLTNEHIALSAVTFGSDILTYYWDFGPDSFPGVSSEIAPEVMYSSDGAHICTLTLTNIWGSAIFPFSVTTGSVPKVNSVTPLSGAVDSTCVFNSEVFGTPPISYSWDFANMCDPATASEATPIVTITDAGEFLCSLYVSNDYGHDTYWFNYQAGVVPDIRSVHSTSTVGNSICWFFSDYVGDTPMTWTWTFDLYAPDPPLVFYGMPTAIMLPGEVGTWTCNVTAENAFGIDSFDFQVEVTEVPPPPLG